MSINPNESTAKLLEGACSLMALMLGIAMKFFSVLVLMNLWNWFIPAAFGLARIGYWLAFGLSLVAMAIRGFHYQKSKTSGADLLHNALIMWAAWIVIFIVGYLVHLAV